MRKLDVAIFKARCQFHQHFMSRFCTNFLLPKIYKPKPQVQKKLLKRLLYEKAACKLLVKLTLECATMVYVEECTLIVDKLLINCITSPFHFISCLYLGSIQIIRDTLGRGGGRGCQSVSKFFFCV